MSIYYPGDGTIAYDGQDRIDKVRELREEAREHRSNSDDYRRIGGYGGHMVSEGLEANYKEKEADRIEHYGK